MIRNPIGGIYDLVMLICGFFLLFFAGSGLYVHGSTLVLELFFAQLDASTDQTVPFLQAVQTTSFEPFSLSVLMMYAALRMVAMGWRDKAYDTWERVQWLFERQRAVDGADLMQQQCRATD